VSRPILLLLLACGAASGFLISNSQVGGSFVPEIVPASRRPLDLLVDTEGVPGVADPRAVTQDLMNQWNAVPEALDVFGVASAGGPYNGATAGSTFGTFTNSQYEVAFDDDGEILTFFGVSSTVLGITLKSVNAASGQLLDFLIVINTRPGSLTAPGSGATTEELFRATLVHELGHALGIGHSPVGMANINTFGFDLAGPARMPSMYPFRLPALPQEGVTIERDDEAALIRSYPGATGGLGSISGDVRALSGAFINEIAVRVLGPDAGGTEHIGIITNGDGRDVGSFTIPNLPPGGYRVILEAINGRASVDEGALAGGSDALGGNPFVLAPDERWQPGDTYDPAVDDPADFALVQVRAGRDTGSVRFVLDGAPLLDGDLLTRSLGGSDSRVPDAGGGFHFGDYYVFSATAGQSAVITAQSAGFTPQLVLLRPSDLLEEASDTPLLGAGAQITRTLAQTGIYTVLVSARATTGNPGGSGAYTISLSGAGGALPPPPAVTAASITATATPPGPQQFSSPVCALPLLSLRLVAPSHEELWVDSIRVRAQGSGHDVTDVASVDLVLDADADGAIDRGEPVLASGTFGADNGSVLFGSLGMELDPGTTRNLLVAYNVTVRSVSSTAGAAFPLLALLPLLLLARRRAAACVLLLALVPLSCGGGGGSGCNGPFNPAGAIVTFEATVAPGDVVAFTSAGDPGAPLAAPAAPAQSGTLSVSN